jgi:hypothetical protein
MMGRTFWTVISKKNNQTSFWLINWPIQEWKGKSPIFIKILPKIKQENNMLLKISLNKITSPVKVMESNKMDDEIPWIKKNFKICSIIRSVFFFKKNQAILNLKLSKETQNIKMFILSRKKIKQNDKIPTEMEDKGKIKNIF